MLQTHLNSRETINLGSFYTPSFLVEFAYKMLDTIVFSSNATTRYELLDSSCGYGNFFYGVEKYNFSKIVGIDIDPKAIEVAKKNFHSIEFYHENALEGVNRDKFKIGANSPLIIVGNPPYNDKTSIIRSEIKQQETFKIDSDLVHRDLGISFLLSYAKIQADFICVLHPLSYLIKEANFRSLRKFASSYRLMDSVIISSSVFCPNSMGHFPISISLYQRSNNGMDYDYIRNFSFKTFEGKKFKLSSFDYIGKYIDKYPNRSRVLDSQRIAMFHTLRDINALRRSKTFVNQQGSNTVNISQSKYSLYCYVDVFKKILTHVPYYLGNCDVIIDFARFKDIEEYFVYSSERKIIHDKVWDYFKLLLGEHYENK